ncbi:MAG: hypothetical protein KDD47_25600, partial [Acidobacteria bacterium]|nr:hypothetical protein [Acidobacteriota bacterium]
GLSLQKLERHTSGLRLRAALGDFIERLAAAFQAKIVLLPVDDLDMAPQHLVDSLRTYQSFLTHARLVPVFTFTDRMSEELIEVEYRNRLQDGAYEPVGTSDKLPISAKLAVQFLARCFPVRNRIRLGPAPARVQRGVLAHDAADPCVSDKDSKEGQEIFELLIASSFLLFGHPDKEDAHQVKAALRPSTLRRQIQVVDAMTDSRMEALRTPQFAVMAQLEDKKVWKLAEYSQGGKDHSAISSELLNQKIKPKMLASRPGGRLIDLWTEFPTGFHESRPIEGRQPRGIPPVVENCGSDRGYWILARNLMEKGINATWTTIFNGATWSLANVHRDILRELGIFLEDLYSWTPSELRSVIVERILAQDRVTRRTVLDRWFNRTD